MASIILKLFQRKKPAPMVCAVTIDPETSRPIADSASHVHTAACFAPFEPLAVAELFQSQSCAACLPALPKIHAAAAGDPNLLLLSYGVGLFDHLGWKDTFAGASRVGDQRQRAYAKIWGRTSLYTPQVVVNGLADGAGVGDGAEVGEVVRRARMAGDGHGEGWRVYLDVNDAAVRIDSDRPVVVQGQTMGQQVMAPQGQGLFQGQQMMQSPVEGQVQGQMEEGMAGQMAGDMSGRGHGHAGHSHPHAPMASPSSTQMGMRGQASHLTNLPQTEVFDLVVVVYKTGDEIAKPAKGPNKGKKMAHRNMVVSIDKIAEWTGGNLTVGLPMPKSAMPHGTEAAVLLQAGFGGRIVAAVKV